MSDLDDELAALEKEVENENKMTNQNKDKSQNNYSNNTNTNYGNNNVPKHSQKVNYEDYGDNSNGLDDFLSDNNNNYNFNNNYSNNNYQNNNYGNQRNNYNNYNPYGNNNNNYQYGNNNNYNPYGNNNNYNPYRNNNNNQYGNNNNYNQYGNNNNYNQYGNNNNYNQYGNNNNNYNQYGNKNNNYNNNRNMNNNPNSNNQSQSNKSYNKTQAQQQPKQSQQPPKQSQNQQQPKQSQTQKQRQSKIDNKNSEINNEPTEDIYPEKQEGMYHKVNEMKSLTVLEEEIALCDKIIEFKKKRGLDYDEWETKKDLAEVQLNSTKTLIENGQMDFEGYKKIILKELQYENKILKFTEMDKKSKPYELNEIKRRIQKRIEIIEKELTQNVDEENAEGEEEKKESLEKKDSINNNSKKLENPNKAKLTNNENIPKNENQTQIIDKKNNNFNIGPIDSEIKPKTEILKRNYPQNENIKQPQNNQIQTQIPQQKMSGQNQHNQIKVPPQYIIQQKVLVTDPKTGKQMYVMKNVVDPKYAEVLKQKQALQQNQKQNIPQQQHHHQQQQPPNQQHIIQQKVLVTDPKTGKQMYVMKNVLDPRYAQQHKQANIPQNQQKHTPKKEPENTEQIAEKQTTKVKQNTEAKQNTQVKPNTQVKQNTQVQQVNNEEKEKYQKYVDALVKEYTEAKEYFKKNGLEKQLGKSREDLKVLLYAKQKIDYKNYKDVKLNALPKPITPEYIFGYSENERMEKFKVVLSQLIKDKNDIEQKMKSILEKLQKLKKKEFEKAKEAVKPKLDEYKTKKEKIIKLMDALKEKFKDKWTPAPEYQKVVEQEQIEKISYEGCKYGLNIKVGKTDYDKDKTFLNLLLEINKSKILKKEVKLKQLGDFNEEWKWEFNEYEWKVIPKTFLYVDLFREHTFSTDKKGSGKIDLTSLRRGATIKSDCKIEIESKRLEPIINFIITPILPTGKKYYETISKDAIKLTKIYPAFTGKQQIQLDNQKQNTTKTNETQTKKTEIKTNNNNNVQAKNTPDNQGKETIIDKSKFKPEELEDVDIIDNLNSLKVLDYKIKELEAKIKKIDGRTPREMLQKKIKMNCKKKQLEEGMGDGSISPKEYMEFMRIQLEHDQLLAMYLKQNNQEEKMKAVMGRVVLLKQEMDELKQYIK